MKKILIVLGCLLSLALVGGVIRVLIAPSPAEINLTNHLKIGFTGKNGEAIPYVLSNEFDLDKKKNEVQAFLKTLDYQFTPDKEVSNGDTVRVTVSFDKDKAKEAHLTIIGDTSLEFVAEDLPLQGDEMAVEMETIDGIQVPKEWTQEQKEIYLEYMQNVSEHETNENMPPLQGETKGHGKVPSAFAKETFELYENAYDYADASSQQYNISPETKEGETTYVVTFQGKAKEWFKGSGKKKGKDREFRRTKNGTTLLKVYENAYQYGEQTNQTFRFENIRTDDRVIGFRVIFQDE